MVDYIYNQNKILIKKKPVQGYEKSYKNTVLTHIYIKVI